MDKLSDLGERLITDSLLRQRYVNQVDFGDDCCVIPVTKNKCLVVTIDPCPKPMSWILGYTDYYYFGWLLATINLSDIAAMGARPIGILTSYILPNETPIKDFERLLDGVDDACQQADAKVLGGNIKESKFISCEAVAIGYANPNRLIRRKGAEVGDFVVVVGDLGLFWAGFLKTKHKLPVSKSADESLMLNILTPRAKVKEGLLVSKYGLLSSGLDNSDGLYPSVKELASQNQVDILLDFSQVDWEPQVSYISAKVGVDPVRLTLGWGDWQLIGTVHPSKYDLLVKKMSGISTSVHNIGKVLPGTGTVHIHHNQETGPMTPIESERFSKNSWFTYGIDKYIDVLLNIPLVVHR